MPVTFSFRYILRSLCRDDQTFVIGVSSNAYNEFESSVNGLFNVSMRTVISDHFMENHAPWIAGVSVLVLLTAAVLAWGLTYTEGHLTSTVDDAFIHMAIARSFAEYGVWGVTPHEFTSSSSSLLWSLLIAVFFRVFGTVTFIPLALALVCSVVLLILIDRLLWGYGCSTGVRFAVQFAVILAVPLPSAVISGMEHVLQALLTVAFAAYSFAALHQRKSLSVWCLLAMLLVATRFEGLFAVGLICLFSVWQTRRITTALALGLAALVPVGIFGLISLSNGWYALPNSVLMKGAGFDFSTPLGIALFVGLRGLLHIARVPAVLLVTIGLGYAFMVQREQRTWRWFALLLIALHLQFAQTGSFFRYEIYLMTIGLVALFSGMRTLIPASREQWMVAFAGALILALPLTGYGLTVTYRTPIAMMNNFHQQYQMGQFLREFYPNESVVLNDIGAPSFYGDIQLIDAAGLGTFATAAAIREEGVLSANSLDVLARDANIALAIVFDLWVDVPSSWILVGSWTISNNVIAAQDTVSFYALDDTRARRLENALRHYNLPDSVEFTVVAQS